jgi:hypothetical protein
MAYILFWFSFGCSFNHVFLTFFASNQFLDQLKEHNCSLIDKLSMIYFRNHHSKLIAKILHLILLRDNGNSIGYSNLIFFTTHPSLVL